MNPQSAAEADASTTSLTALHALASTFAGDPKGAVHALSQACVDAAELAAQLTASDVELAVELGQQVVALLHERGDTESPLAALATIWSQDADAGDAIHAMGDWLLDALTAHGQAQIEHEVDEGISDEARKSEVRRRWLQDHRGEPVRLDGNSVGDIAFLLVEAEVQPTVETVRFVNGGKGSPNVIHPGLRAFFRQGLRRRFALPRATPGVPAPLLALWGAAMDEALIAVQSQLAEQKAALDKRSDGLVGREANLAQRELQQDERELAQSKLVATLQEQVEQTRTERVSAEQQRQAAEELARTEGSAREAAEDTVARQKEAIAALHQKLETAMAERAESNAQWIERESAWIHDREKLNNELLTAQQARAASATRLDAALSIQAVQQETLTQMRLDHASALKGAALATDTARAELAAALASAAAMERDLIGLKAARDMLQASLDGTRAERDRLLVQQAEQGRRLDALSDRLEAVSADTTQPPTSEK